MNLGLQLLLPLIAPLHRLNMALSPGKQRWQGKGIKVYQNDMV
jgi:hypothetical protein